MIQQRRCALGRPRWAPMGGHGGYGRTVCQPMGFTESTYLRSRFAAHGQSAGLPRSTSRSGVRRGGKGGVSVVPTVVIVRLCQPPDEDHSWGGLVPRPVGLPPDDPNNADELPLRDLVAIEDLARRVPEQLDRCVLVSVLVQRSVQIAGLTIWYGGLDTISPNFSRFPTAFLLRALAKLYTRSMFESRRCWSCDATTCSGPNPTSGPRRFVPSRGSPVKPSSRHSFVMAKPL